MYAITPKVARLLMEIEAARADIEHIPVPATVEAELRHQARVRSTHYSTRIEGNRLTLAEAEKVIQEAGTKFHGRERDVREVRDYYEGRADADLTAWVEYFVETLAETFQAVRREAHLLVTRDTPSEPETLRKLDRRARMVLALFAGTDRISAEEVARILGLSARMARVLLTKWVADGWLAVADPSRRKRAYELTATYRQYMGSLSAKGDHS